MYATLPRQIVHRDFDGSNALLEDNRITGILDFEFAARDLRAGELAAPLMQFSRNARDTVPDWEPIRAFAAGYRARIALSRDEIEAVPDLTRLWRASTLVHREGKRRRGQADMADVVARARGLLRIDAWLATEGELLVDALIG